MPQDATYPTYVLAEELGHLLLAHGQTVTTAESCTGGLIAGAITDVPGSSNWFERGFVTYANIAKVDMLGVPPMFLETVGAVSEPVVAAMAQGAADAARAQWAVAVSGVAGPGGGSAEKPVGTVWFAWATPMGIETERRIFSGDRHAVRAATVQHALRKLIAFIKDNQ
ncbi:CinA family protein [Silvimonas iriomotensis]|uniref:Nicotinamide-nucleotide amidohydrolase PncC n=1 Tax=Silvimonas iriomotensis TaxID=449662 RepID=A0ABQ2P8M6_9NEIS|nr:CinA family protein [Silvimonas iriomotensis]GGP20903.1 nicotinamide-nucleotide amidohydrolase PncC [Silvimonas iriomotensis]